jgi:hypothetical protein
MVIVELQSSNSFATAFYNSNQNMIQITLSGNENSVAAVRLINLAGKTLKEEKFSSREKKIIVKDLPAGIYLFEISSEGKTVIKKIPVMK